MQLLRPQWDTENVCGCQRRSLKGQRQLRNLLRKTMRLIIRSSYALGLCSGMHRPARRRQCRTPLRQHNRPFPSSESALDLQSSLAALQRRVQPPDQVPATNHPAWSCGRKYIGRRRQQLRRRMRRPEFDRKVSRRRNYYFIVD